MTNVMNLINELHLAVERPAAPEVRAHVEGVVYHTLNFSSGSFEYTIYNRCERYHCTFVHSHPNMAS
jgi:hypothetical protein